VPATVVLWGGAVGAGTDQAPGTNAGRKLEEGRGMGMGEQVDGHVRRDEPRAPPTLDPSRPQSVG
jgi:hypothetical protein